LLATMGCIGETEYGIGENRYGSVAKELHMQAMTSGRVSVD